MDFAKRLLDHGFHAPTTYFPLLVPECLLIEPTETESKEALDAFVDAMAHIQKEAEEEPEHVTRRPAYHAGPPSRRRARRQATGSHVEADTVPPRSTDRLRSRAASPRLFRALRRELARA